MPIVSQVIPPAASVSALPQQAACDESGDARMRQADAIHARHFENARKDVIAASGEVAQ